jgi:hypothetical protein
MRPHVNGLSTKGMEALEMEAPGLYDSDDERAPIYHSNGSKLHHHQPAVNKLEMCCLCIQLHLEAYPRVATLLFVLVIGGTFGAVITIFSPFSHGLSLNTMPHDYSAIDFNYNFKSAQVEHWCLFVSDLESCGVRRWSFFS